MRKFITVILTFSAFALIACSVPAPSEQEMQTMVKEKEHSRSLARVVSLKIKSCDRDKQNDKVLYCIVDAEVERRKGLNGSWGDKELMQDKTIQFEYFYNKEWKLVSKLNAVDRNLNYLN